VTEQLKSRSFAFAGHRVGGLQAGVTLWKTRATVLVVEPVRGFVKRYSVPLASTT